MDKIVIGEVFFQNVKNSAGDFSRLFLCDGSSAHQFEEGEQEKHGEVFIHSDIFLYFIRVNHGYNILHSFIINIVGQGTGT